MTSFDYREPVQAQTSLEADQIEFLERLVRFSLRHCSVKRSECISNVAKDRQVLKALYGRFGHFEQMNWQQARGTDHKKFISIESKSSTNHQKLLKAFPGFETFCHMRVNHPSKPKFRVFGALVNDSFCILKFDIDGVENH
jgi:hypothetical protein